MGMGPITEIISRPYTITLGESDYLVSEFRLIDLADLQQFLNDRHDDPISGLRSRIETEGIEAIERDLALAYAEADSLYRYVHGEYIAKDPEERLEQAIHFMYVALRRWQPELTPEDIREIASTLEPGQYGKLNRVAWGTQPVEEIGKLLGMTLRQQRSSAQWPKVIVETMAAYPAYRLEDIYKLTLTELFYLRSGGAPRPGPAWRIVGSWKDAAEKQRRWWNRVVLGKTDV